MSPSPVMEGSSPDPTEKEFDALLGKDGATPDNEGADRAGIDSPDGPTTVGPPAERTASVDPRRLRRDRIAFFFGILLTSSGAFGLLVGSVLHDVLRVPWFGTAYGVFGPLNVTAAAMGAALLIPGLVALLFGLRGGVIPAKRASEG